MQVSRRTFRLFFLEAVAKRHFGSPSCPKNRRFWGSETPSTYCEAENLLIIVPRIDAALGGGALRWEILVIDDESPDDTSAACVALAENHALRLFIRVAERGLASAVLYGIGRAAGAVVVFMDADLSHPPEKIPEFDPPHFGRRV
jgi:cellulose synthase/poly-beta-1,6-N-acetylglucosamine synthase-like glycosyltransferase